MKPVDIASTAGARGSTRKSRRLAALVTAAGSLMIAGLSFGPLTASAAEAPNCVSTELDDSGFIDHLTVINQCGIPLRIKVVLANAPDMPCIQLTPDQPAKSYQWIFPGRFDKLLTC